MKNVSHPYSEQPKVSSSNDAKNTVSCVICAATYAPDDAHEYLSQASPIALESALMSMCHFCFRCRRPACPDCWDEVHGVCGACAQEAHLPFRTDAGPLNGAFFASPSQAQKEMQKSLQQFPLVCMRHGRFQPTTANLITSEATRPAPAITSYQPHQSSIQKRRPAAIQAAQAARASRLAISAVDTQLPPRVAIAQPPAYLHQKQQAQVKAEVAFPSKLLSLSSTELIVTFILLVILLVVIAIISMALFSSVANIFITNWLNVDIQTEIAYLLQLTKRLH